AEFPDPSSAVNSASEPVSADSNSAHGNAAKEIHRSAWGAAELASGVRSALESVAFARWLTLLGLAYAAAGAFLLGRWLLGHLVLWRLLRSAQPAPEAVARLFETMVEGRRRRPRLL